MYIVYIIIVYIFENNVSSFNKTKIIFMVHPKLTDLKEPVLTEIYGFKQANTLREILLQSRKLQKALNTLEDNLNEIIRE